MKDIKVTYTNKSLIDLTPIRQNGTVTFVTVENEPKLVQSLVKLFLTPSELHVFGCGADYENFDENEIVNVLKLYDQVSETDNPAERIGTVEVKYISDNEYEVVITTQKGTEISLKAGI